MGTFFIFKINSEYIYYIYCMYALDLYLNTIIDQLILCIIN